MERGLDCYDPEGRVFLDIAAKVKARRELCKRDVLLILKWKTKRLRDNYSITIGNDQMRSINQAIAEAKSNGLGALEMLQGIPGIKLAVATAILTVCYPNRFSYRNPLGFKRNRNRR